MIRQVILSALFSLELVYAMFGYPNAKPLSSYGLQLKLSKWYVRIGEGASTTSVPLLRDEHYYTMVDRKLYELDNLGFHTIAGLRGESENIESVEHYCETQKTGMESCSKVIPISKEAALSPVQFIKRQSAGQVTIGKGKDMKFGPLLKFDEFYAAVDRTIYKLEDLGAKRKRITPAMQQESLSQYLATHNMLTEETPKDDLKKSETGAPASSHNAIPADAEYKDKTELNKSDTNTAANKTSTKTQAEVSGKEETPINDSKKSENGAFSSNHNPIPVEDTDANKSNTAASKAKAEDLPKEEPKIDPNAKKTSLTHCSVQ